MTEVTSKEELAKTDGKLVFRSAVKSHVDAAASASKHGYLSWWWDKKNLRLYGMLPRAKNAESETK